MSAVVLILKLVNGKIIRTINKLFDIDLMTVTSDMTRIPKPESRRQKMLENVMNAFEARMATMNRPSDGTIATAINNRSNSSLIKQQEKQQSTVSS